METTELAKPYTIARYRQLKAKKNRKLIADLIYKRFYERYICPFKGNSNRHGFSMMAVNCLMIEALQSFKEGKTDTKQISENTFKNFFKASNYFKEYVSYKRFYHEIRCGILHQAETRNGWKIRRDGKQLLDIKTKTINADLFFEAIQKELKDYKDELQKQPFESEVWKYAIMKLDHICTISCQK